jgi:hypothetical protein
MLAASILLVFALEEANTRYAWGSAAIITSLVAAAVCWVAFVGWEVWIEGMGEVTGEGGGRGRRGKMEPIFPMRLLRSRVLVGMLLFVYFLFSVTIDPSS